MTVTGGPWGPWTSHPRQSGCLRAGIAAARVVAQASADAVLAAGGTQVQAQCAYNAAYNAAMDAANAALAGSGNADALQVTAVTAAASTIAAAAAAAVTDAGGSAEAISAAFSGASSGAGGAGSCCFQSASIAHGQLAFGTELLSDEVEIELVTDDADHPLRLFTTPMLRAPMSVTIYQTDADLVLFGDPIFSGRVQGVEFGDNGKINVKLSSILRVGEQSVPRMMVQRTCNHRLFDANCTKLPASFSATGTVSALANTYVESDAFAAKLAGLSPSDDSWFTLGYVTVGTERRVAVNNAGNRIYIDSPFSAAVDVGDAITATAGCDGRTTTCERRFNNLDHCLAFPFLPNQNPQFEALKTPPAQGGKK